MENERDFLEQQLFREENCVSMYTRFAGLAGDSDLGRIFSQFSKRSQARCDQLRALLADKGIPTDNVMQNRATEEAMPVGGYLSIETSQPVPAETMPPVRGDDENMVADALLAMKVVSDAYRSALSVTDDERTCAALIDMRREVESEKEHLVRYIGHNNVPN